MKKLCVLILMAASLPGNSQQAEVLIFREKIHDFGDLDEIRGSADHEFVFTNNSGRPVKIISVQASCGCTTPGWSQNPVPQGKTGFIKVSFDPKGRPGYFNKSLTVLTDLDANPIVLQIKGQVSSGTSASLQGELTVAMGNLYFKTRSFNFETVYINKAPVERQFPVENRGSVAIRFMGAKSPSHIVVKTPWELGPKQSGFISVTYDAKRRNQFGFTSDNVELITDDSGNESKPVSVFATLEEYYPVPTGEELAKAPMLSLKEQSLDLGNFRPGVTIDRIVSLRNSGKRDLQIKFLQGNCGCITAEVEKSTIKPGDSTQLKISFTPQNRSGTQQKAITIYSNDPRAPVQRLNIQAYVED